MNDAYFKRLAEESQIQTKKADPAILAMQVQKYLSAGKTITVVPLGASGVVLSPMGICKRTIEGAEK